METELLVTNVLATGTAFGVLSEDMTQNVFIPSKHAINAGLRPGQKILAQIVPNVTHGEKTPWVVISIEGHEPTTGTTLRELAKFLDADVRDVEDELRAMKLPHTELWALGMSDLTEVPA
jgi:hypothetical protein